MAESRLLLVPFRGARGGTGPLTFGQRNTWNWVGNEADRSSAVLHWGLDLPDGATLADIEAAFAVLLSRHEALRTSYSTDGEPAQCVATGGQLTIEVHELAAGLDDDEVIDLLADRLRGKGVDFTRELPLRVAVGTRRGMPAAAVVLYSHMAVDFASMALIARQFTELLSNPDCARDEPPGHQPLDQAVAERTAHGLRQAESAVRYWENHLSTAPQSAYPMPPPDRPVEGFLSGFLHSPAGGLAMGHIAARVGAGRQAVLLAALCAVLAQRTGTNRCVFTSVSSNRFRVRLRDYVGSLAQDGLTALDLDTPTFDELVQRANRATLAANTHSLFDANELWRVIDEIGYRRGTRFTRDFTVNNISAHLDGEPSGDGPGDPNQVIDALPRTTVRWAESAQYPVVLMCNPVRLAPELLVALTADTTQVTRSEIELLLRGVERLLVAAAVRNVPLAGTRLLTGVESVSRGPDWALVDACWISLSASRRLLIEALSARAALVVPEGGALTGYVSAGNDFRTPERAHAACMTTLRTPGWRIAMAPARYVLCDGVPTDPTDEASWRALPVIAAGTGRTTEA
ncbi:hypothetical protein F0L68_27290 [Solihabitans fulvus]|uniref:Condensation domain-containing protein n=1 Tax=Solihabitans fulvus TaxID=1892852 RepID=A0A5B2WYA6_9PSEU|nr:condensation domain-containing protein [Solihabitans fulvus]KAA2255900.1 hypothetical protein F0L68_27290 [Solihabitans fulvus]